MRKRIFAFLGILALLLIVILIVVLLWVYTDNTGLLTTSYQITDEKIPPEFNGFRIAQIADLHNTEFGEGNQDLLEALRESEPDIIVFTGDQVDSRKKDLDVVLELAEQAIKIAPCYLITGNHEGSIVENVQLNTQLKEIGFTVLEDDIVELQQGQASMTLIGILDPTLNSWFMQLGLEKTADTALSLMTWPADRYTILLAHHPEYLQTYASHGVDLVLSGHAHGGQIRIGDQGIIAPHQGLFPKYDAGLYTEGNTTMVLSRGLGNSRFPWRINNPPELVVVELSSQQ